MGPVHQEKILTEKKFNWYGKKFRYDKILHIWLYKQTTKTVAKICEWMTTTTIIDTLTTTITRPPTSLFPPHHTNTSRI